jgi:hypothetical protein
MQESLRKKKEKHGRAPRRQRAQRGDTTAARASRFAFDSP